MSAGLTSPLAAASTSRIDGEIVHSRPTAHPDFVERFSFPRSMLEVEFLWRGCRLEVHATIIYRAGPCRRAGILHEQHRAAGFGAHLVFEVRIFHVDQCARTVAPLAHLELAVEDVPDLREVVL